MIANTNLKKTNELLSPKNKKFSQFRKKTNFNWCGLRSSCRAGSGVVTGVAHFDSLHGLHLAWRPQAQRYEEHHAVILSGWRANADVSRPQALMWHKAYLCRN